MSAQKAQKSPDSTLTVLSGLTVQAGEMASALSAEGQRMTPAYARNLRSRDRHRRGLRVFRIELGPDHLRAMIDHGLLAEADATNHQAISTATGTALLAYARLAGRVMPDAPQTRLAKLTALVDAVLKAAEGRDIRAPISLIVEPLRDLYEYRNGEQIK